jgi:Protein of unknown function (DUF4242)
MAAPRASARETRTYLVERYWPGVDEASLRDALPRLERAASALTAEGRPVEHVGSLLVADDEVVFSVISAGSESEVLEVNERAELPVDRIATVTPHGFGGN